MAPHHPTDRTARAPGGARDRAHRPRTARRPLRIVAILSAAALALCGGLLAPATAATTTGWADWEPLSGAPGDYSTSIAPLAGGFPGASMVTDSRGGGGIGVISGQTNWLSASTPVGQKYGSSRDEQYLNLRPRADTSTGASTTIYTFEQPTPASGWTFVLGDIDADQVQVTATDAADRVLTADELGYRGGFNYCAPGLVGKPSCTGAATDVPTWDAATQTLTGNVGAVDTAGAAGWFEPTVEVSTLTLSFTRRAGLPVYQTWFAALARDVSGTVSDVTPGAEGPAAGIELALFDAQGRLVGTTTSAADGTYGFGAYTATAGYTVEVAAPPDKIADTQVRLAVDLTAADATDVDFAIRDIVPSAVSGTVVDQDGAPVPGVEVTITTPGTGATQTVVTRADGSYLFDTVPAGTHDLTLVPPPGYQLTVGPDPVVIPGGSESPVTGQTFVLQAAPAYSLSGTVTAGGAPVAEVAVVATSGSDSFLAYTGPDGTYSFGDLPPGDWTVTVEPPAGFEVVGPASRDETVVDSDVTGVDFALAPVPAGVISGLVTTEGGTPVPGVEVVVDGPDGAVTLTTDASGSYAVDGLAPGDYTVTVLPPGGFTVEGQTTLSVTITSGGEVVADQDFVLLAVVTPEPTPEPTTPEPTDPPTTVDPTDEPTDPTAPPATGSPTSPAPGTPPGGPGTPGSGSGGLPVTGGDPAAPLAVAALLVAVGIGTLAVRRRAGTRG